MNSKPQTLSKPAAGSKPTHPSGWRWKWYISSKWILSSFGVILALSNTRLKSRVKDWAKIRGQHGRNIQTDFYTFRTGSRTFLNSEHSNKKYLPLRGHRHNYLEYSFCIFFLFFSETNQNFWFFSLLRADWLNKVNVEATFLDQTVPPENEPFDFLRLFRAFDRSVCFSVN